MTSPFAKAPPNHIPPNLVLLHTLRRANQARCRSPFCSHCYCKPGQVARGCPEPELPGAINGRSDFISGQLQQGTANICIQVVCPDGAVKHRNTFCKSYPEPVLLVNDHIDRKLLPESDICRCIICPGVGLKFSNPVCAFCHPNDARRRHCDGFTTI